MRGVWRGAMQSPGELRVKLNTPASGSLNSISTGTPPATLTLTPVMPRESQRNTDSLQICAKQQVTPTLTSVWLDPPLELNPGPVLNLRTLMAVMAKAIFLLPSIFVLRTRRMCWNFSGMTRDWGEEEPTQHRLGTSSYDEPHAEHRPGVSPTSRTVPPAQRTDPGGAADHTISW